MIASLESRAIRFDDIHTHRGVAFPKARGKRALQARLKTAAVVADDPSMPLGRRIGLRIEPLLQQGKLAEAEAILAEWLLERPPSPFHVVTELDVTTPPEKCAAAFDAFAATASAQHELAAVYTEMNGFTINTDAWFCGAFGFARHGGHDGYDWLSEFNSSSDDSLPITGLEPLQAAFAERMALGAKRQDDADTLLLTEALVIVKFQRLLQRSLPLMTVMKCPLFASAHDYDSFTIEIRPATSLA